MSTTIGLAHNAFEAYQLGDHTQCGRFLDQIQTQKTDVKVAHNLAVNSYFQSGCVEPQSLLSQLSTQHDRAREQEKKDRGKKKKEDDDEDGLRDDDDLYVLRT